MATVGDIGERGLLARIARVIATGARGGRGRGRGAGVVIDVGDDAAVLTAIGPHAVLTTDLLVEGVDFAWSWARPSDVGHKAAAVNLSDLAAMGARPRALLLSLALRPADSVNDVLALVRALDRTGRRYGAPLVGGDLSATSGPMVISVTAVGEADPRRTLVRGGARAGDAVLVSGTLGAAAAALALFLAGERPRTALARRQLRPEPRVELGRALARSGLVASCADLSDGLGSDALHLVGRGLGVELEPQALPLAPGVVQAARRLGRSPLDFAVHGGEDFELVLAARPRHVAALRRIARRSGTELTVVGRVGRSPGLVLAGAAVTGHGGFDHFGREPSRRSGV